jgi:hypothetical protein
MKPLSFGLSVVVVLIFAFAVAGATSRGRMLVTAR